MTNTQTKRGIKIKPGIYKYGKDRWLIRIDFGEGPDGKRQRQSEIFHGLLKDAEKRRVELLAKKNEGSLVWSTKETLDKWLDVWLETSVKATRAVQTYQQYKEVMRNYARPSFGKKLLSDIKHGNVQALYDKMTADGYSSSTVRYTNSVLKLAFNAAIKQGKVSVNPCQSVDLPKQKRANETIKSMTREQAKAFHIASYDEPRGIVYRLALELGTRMEETLALRWADIDIDAKKVTIRRALVYSRAKGEGWFFSKTKTKSGDRTVTLSDKLVWELKAHRAEQVKMMMLLGTEYDRELDLVFANEFGGVLDQFNLRRRTFKRILTAAQIADKGFTPHCLRHTAATLQLDSASNPKVISERLGHSSVKFTLDRYVWNLPEQEEELAADYAKALYG